MLATGAFCQSMHMHDGLGLSIGQHALVIRRRVYFIKLEWILVQRRHFIPFIYYPLVH